MARRSAVAYLALAGLGLVLDRTTNGEEAARDVRPIPRERKSISRSAVALLHPLWQDGAVWPNQDSIAARSIALSGRDAALAVWKALDWTRTILKDEWAPDEAVVMWAKENMARRRGIPERYFQNIGVRPGVGRAPEWQIHALAGDVWGCDAVRFRYEGRGYMVQVAVVAWAVVSVVQPVDARATPPKLDEEEARALVRTRIGQFLRESEKIADIAMATVTRVGLGFKGQRDKHRDTGDRWWGNVRWWTDGSAVLFMSRVPYLGPTPPQFTKHWFTESPAKTGDGRPK